MDSLQGRVVWVTGAGSGIGRATAVAFARAGAKVALTGRRVDALEATSALLGGAGLVAPADVARADQVAAAHAAIEQALGPVDVLVNNAGRNTVGRHMSTLAPADLVSLVEANLASAFLCSLAVLPAMRARKRGTLVHVASMAATMVFPAAGAGYAAAKAGVRQMSAHINAEEGINGIRSICVNPGEVATEILATRPRPPSVAERELMLAAEDVAAAILFAASMPGRATMAELTIVPTDNQAWRGFAQGLAAAQK